MGLNLHRASVPIAFLLVGFALSSYCYAESGYVLVHVQDTQHHPVRGVEIGIEGSGGSKLTGDDGKARLPIGNAVKQGDWLSFDILHSPRGADYVLLSPWDNRSQVPSFEDKPENFIRLVVVRRGDRMALESNIGLASLTAKIKNGGPKSANEQGPREDPKASLNTVAEKYGLGPEDVDKAIRAWGAKTTDPYEAGLAALYERDFPKASDQLQDSLKQREEMLTSAKKTEERAQIQVADAALFLATSLYEQGKYSEAAQAYKRCSEIRPDDPQILNNMAVSLLLSHNSAEAEPIFFKALSIDEKASGNEDLRIAAVLGNLALLFQFKGDYAKAEEFFNRALAIDEKVQGPDHSDEARDLNNLALLLQSKGDISRAETFFRLAREKSPLQGYILNNLALLLQAKGELTEAESLFRQTIQIDMKVLGLDHLVARDLNNLAFLLERKGDYDGAEPLFRQAVDIDQKALGQNSILVAMDLSHLSELLMLKRDYAEAEQLCRRAININERLLGPDDPATRLTKINLDILLKVEKQGTRQ